MKSPDGPCPRFGSCHLILKPEVSQRCTYTYKDSYRNPIDKGTIDTLHDILSAVLTDSFELDYALGIRNIRPKDLKLLWHVLVKYGELLLK